VLTDYNCSFVRKNRKLCLANCGLVSASCPPHLPLGDEGSLRGGTKDERTSARKMNW
jgi:hypothetical protein